MYHLYQFAERIDQQTLASRWLVDAGTQAFIKLVMQHFPYELESAYQTNSIGVQIDLQVGVQNQVFKIRYSE